TAGTSYSFTVRARDAAGNNSAQSTALNVTTSAASGGGTVIYEAENATKTGGVANATTYTNYSASAYVTGFQNNGASVQFAVNVATAGVYNVRMRYSNAAGPGYPISIYVNGAKITTELLSSNTSWTTWQDVSEPLTLNAGNNTIKYQKDPDNNGGAYNIDYIAIPGTPGAIGSVKEDDLSKQTTDESAISIYPNPASNSFNVATAGGVKIAITTLDGKLIKSISAKDKLTTIDSSKWNPGVYIINVQTENQSTIKKLVIAQ
ncbi:MAG: T9SS C-terminal target domain-containing protein, partial [Sphingobacteriales bacterium]